MQLVTCYDVPVDSRRTRLHKRLVGFLKPVQKSVFEGPLEARRVDDLLRAVRGAISPRKDDVRIYRLCPSCAERTILLGTARPLQKQQHLIIV